MAGWLVGWLAGGMCAYVNVRKEGEISNESASLSRSFVRENKCRRIPGKYCQQLSPHIGWLGEKRSARDLQKRTFFILPSTIYLKHICESLYRAFIVSCVHFAAELPRAETGIWSINKFLIADNFASHGAHTKISNFFKGLKVSKKTHSSYLLKRWALASFCQNRSVSLSTAASGFLSRYSM
jgi:hypothetical protein